MSAAEGRDGNRGGRRTVSPLLLAYALNPVALSTFWLLRGWGVVADVPLWTYFAVLWGGALCSTGTELLARRRPNRLTSHARIAAQAACVTAAIYVTGWGPAMAVAYAFMAQENVGSGGARTWRITAGWSVAGMLVGQLAILNDWAPSLLEDGLANGLAAANAVGIVFVIRMAGAVAAQKERAEASLRESAERFHCLIQNSSDLTLVLDADSVVTYASEASGRLLGIPADELVGQQARPLVHPSDIKALRARLRADLSEHEVAQPVELRVRVADGGWRYFEAVVANLRNRPAVGGIVVNARDITERKRAEAALEHQALHDALTGLPNRLLFLDHLEQAIAQTSRHPVLTPAVAFIDLDRFKLVNDGLGHDAGDELLGAVAARLRATLRPSDTVSRFGGDEFVVLCQGVASPAAAEALGDRILSCFVEPFVLGDERVRVSASVGVAVHDRGEAATDLVRQADEAMYRAKNNGRGRVQVFDGKARGDALVRVHTEAALRSALAAGDLRLYYQPIFDVASLEPVGVEALLRWHHPSGDLLAPADFLAVAENSGLIVPIGQWVLGEACRQVREWNAEREHGNGLTLSVNLSARELAEPGLVRTVRDVLREARAGGPFDLVLELTETCMIEDPEGTGARMRELCELGVRFAIDDFGTGFSSLSYLRDLPLSIVKIDGAFVAALGTTIEDEAIVRAVVQLGRSLGLQVIAEGVETDEQLARLRELGCERAQGFLLAIPGPAARLTPAMTGAPAGAFST